MTVTEHIRNHLLRGIDLSPVGHKTDSQEAMRVSRWNDEFERHMRDRLFMGYFRYGTPGENLQGCATRTSGYDQIGSAIARLRLYQETGNQEHLVDAANLSLVEWHQPSIGKPVFFDPVDDGIHTPRREAI